MGTATKGCVKAERVLELCRGVVALEDGARASAAPEGSAEGCEEEDKRELKLC